MANSTTNDNEKACFFKVYCFQPCIEYIHFPRFQVQPGLCRTGGHILALYAALITGPNDDGLYINHPKNVSLRALGLNSAELQIPEVKKLSTAQRHMFSDLIGQELSEQLLDKVRLEHRITKDFPAVYMIAGNKDPLCAHIPAFCRLLSEKGVEHRCKIYGTEKSPLGHVFFLDIRKKNSEEATNDELNYFMEMYPQKNI